MDIGLIIQSEGSVGAASLASTDRALDGQEFFRLRLTRFFRVNDGFYSVEFVCKTELVCSVHVLENYVIMNGKVSGCLISDMYVMSLMHKTYEGSAHGNDIIVRMWREDEDSLREWQCRYRSLAVVSIRFSARPSGYSMLKVVEYLDVNLVIRTELVDEFAE